MIKKISFERRAYESVDEKSLSLVISRKTTKKNLGGLRLRLLKSSSGLYLLTLLIKLYQPPHTDKQWHEAVEII